MTLLDLIADYSLMEYAPMIIPITPPPAKQSMDYTLFLVIF